MKTPTYVWVTISSMISGLAGFAGGVAIISPLVPETVQEVRSGKITVPPVQSEPALRTDKGEFRGEWHKDERPNDPEFEYYVKCLKRGVICI